jgi:phosphinothricin acetyltransferase
MQSQHWPRVKEIYLEAIATGNSTFQQQAPEWQDWDKVHLVHSRIVAELEGDIVGWTALMPVSTRPVYAGVAELSICITKNLRGKSIGNVLLQQLVKSSEENKIWTLQASIFPENAASIRIHEKNGFRIIGFREKIGQMNGVWRDTLLLERRSKIVGI